MRHHFGREMRSIAVCVCVNAAQSRALLVHCALSRLGLWEALPEVDTSRASIHRRRLPTAWRSLARAGFLSLITVVVSCLLGCLVPAAASSRAARAICWQLCQHRGAGALMSIQARPPAPPLLSRGSSHQGPLKGGGAPSSRRAAARRRPAVDSGEMTDSGGTVRCRAGVP